MRQDEKREGIKKTELKYCGHIQSGTGLAGGAALASSVVPELMRVFSVLRDDWEKEECDPSY